MCGRREGKRGFDNKIYCFVCLGYKFFRIYEEGLGCCGYRREDYVGENWFGIEKKNWKKRKENFGE